MLPLVFIVAVHCFLFTVFCSLLLFTNTICCHTPYFTDGNLSPPQGIGTLVSLCAVQLKGGGFQINIPMLHRMLRETFRGDNSSGVSVNDQMRYSGSVNSPLQQGGMEGGGANNGGIRNWKQIEKDSLTWAMRWNNYSKRLHQRVRRRRHSV